MEAVCCLPQEVRERTTEQDVDVVYCLVASSVGAAYIQAHLSGRINTQQILAKECSIAVDFNSTKFHLEI